MFAGCDEQNSKKDKLFHQYIDAVWKWRENLGKMEHQVQKQYPTKIAESYRKWKQVKKNGLIYLK